MPPAPLSTPRRLRMFCVLPGVFLSRRTGGLGVPLSSPSPTPNNTSRSSQRLPAPSSQRAERFALRVVVGLPGQCGGDVLESL